MIRDLEDGAVFNMAPEDNFFVPCHIDFRLIAGSLHTLQKMELIEDMLKYIKILNI